MNKAIAAGIMLAGMLSLAATAGAQATNDITLTAAPDGDHIALTISMDIQAAPPADWVGWTVERTATVDCSAAQVGDVTPFPTGSQVFPLTDNTAGDGITYKYVVVGVTDQGEHVPLSGAPGAPPAWTYMDYAGLGLAPASVGTIVTGGPFGYTLNACAGACWPDVLVPVPVGDQDLVDLADTGTIVVLYGDIDVDMEGPYMSGSYTWAALADCNVVAATPTSWSTLKQSYR